MGTGGSTTSSTRVALGSTRAVIKPGGTPHSLPRSGSLAVAFDPAELRERLRKIRPVAPSFEEELEIARRQATRLCAQNRRVLEEVRRLQKQRGQMDARADEHCT